MANRPPVVTVNNRDVYSDKQVESVVNTRVTFTDGSWCDIATNEVVNNGLGYISIGTPAGMNSEKTTFGPKAYKTTSLDVQGVKADVDIQPVNGQEMTVAIEGPKPAVERVVVRLQGDTLTIQRKDGDGTSIRGVVIRGDVRGGISIGGGSIGIGGRRIVAGRNTVVMSGVDESDTKVSIGVPKGCAVKVAGVQGKVTIGDTEGPLHASVLGDDIKAGSVRDATLLVQGSGDIDVVSVNGNLTMNIQGSGGILVRGGSVKMLSSTIMGSGNAYFSGEATDANLSVVGSGGIYVSSVKNRPNKTLMGSGYIKVDNWSR